jgi:hypothetical protein
MSSPVKSYVEGDNQAVAITGEDMSSPVKSTFHR